MTVEEVGFCHERNTVAIDIGFGNQLSFYIELVIANIGMMRYGIVQQANRGNAQSKKEE